MVPGSSGRRPAAGCSLILWTSFRPCHVMDGQGTRSGHLGWTEVSVCPRYSSRRG
jgi:hypothetical protein